MVSEKTELRTKHRAIRRAIAESPEIFREKSALIQHNLLADSNWARSAAVILYHAFGGEVSTDLLLERAWAEDKTVYLPRCLPGEKGLMNLHRCTGLEDLEPGSYGIQEPKISCPVLEMTEIGDALIVVPALAFDRQGYRLGYGGGYYDRLLAREHGVSVGLCFADNFESALPREGWDIPVNGVCTEEKLFWV